MYLVHTSVMDRAEEIKVCGCGSASSKLLIRDLDAKLLLVFKGNQRII